MSELRIGLVAEGPTDKLIIEAALDAILEQTFVLTLIQPEPRGDQGGFSQTKSGWGGVYHWCRQMVEMGSDASLSRFHLVLIHLDADVAEKSYADYQIDPPRDDLPCARPCPPAADSVVALRRVVLGWLEMEETGLPRHWLFCTPSKSSETWYVAARYRSVCSEIDHLECAPGLEAWLAGRPAAERVIRWKDGKQKKVTRAYRDHVHHITSQWSRVVGSCQQAASFTDEVRGKAQVFPRPC